MSKSKTSNKGKQMANTDDVQNKNTIVEGSNENQQVIQQVDEGLIGSDLVPTNFVVDGKEVTAGDFIKELFGTTGLTVAEWNGLSTEDRDVKVKAGLDALGVNLDATDESQPKSEEVKTEQQNLEDQVDPKTNDTPEPPKVEEQTTVGTIVQQTNDTPASNEDLVEVNEESKFNFRSILVSDQLKQLVEETAALDDYTNTVLNGVFEYMDEMKPKRQMSPKDGGKNQANLYRTIRYMFITPNDNFAKLFSVFLAIVNEFKDTGKVFNERYLFRFPESIQLNQSETDTFWKWLQLFITTSDAKDRKYALTQVNVNKALSQNLTEDARNKIINFYNI